MSSTCYCNLALHPVIVINIYCKFKKKNFNYTENVIEQLSDQTRNLSVIKTLVKIIRGVLGELLTSEILAMTLVL